MALQSSEETLMELIIRWEDANRRGREVSVEELCRDRPELAAELARRIRTLGRVDGAMGLRENGSFLSTEVVDAGGDSAAEAWIIPSVMHSSTVYRPQRRHAQGGQGEVFTARHEDLDRTVALKRIRPDKRGDSARRRFLREAAITARLQHPGVVPIYGLGHDEDGPFYTMPLIEGETLREAIDDFHHAATTDGASRRQLRFRDLLQRFVAASTTVAYAHDQGVVHRDLKPSNIMLGCYGETLVMDWGLAKRIGGDDDEAGDAFASPTASPDHLTATGAVLGTPRYMSPEQAKGEPIGPASDVYSLGLILYTILTGNPPFHDEFRLEGDLWKAIRDGAVEPPRRRAPGLPRALEAICLKALAARPEDRYSSPRALAEDVSNWLADEPAAAYHEPWTARAGRWMRRRRALVTTTAVAVVIAAVSLGVVALLLVRANRREQALRNEAVVQKTRAEQARERAEIESKRAREQARKAARFSEFLVDLFQSADPLGVEGRGFREPSEGIKDLTAVQILERGAERVRDAPSAAGTTGEVSAALMDAIGNALRGLGELEKARPLLEAALAQRRAAADPAGRPLAQSLFHMGILEHDYQDFESSKRDYEQALQLLERIGEADDPDVRKVRFRLAWLLGEMGRTDQAERAFREILQERTARLGPDHPEVQLVRLALLVVTLDLGNRAALLARARELVGRNNLLTDVLIAYLRAMTTRLAHRYPSAIRQYEDVLATARKRLPPRHPLLAMLLGDMAGLYRQAGDPSRAEVMMREAVAIGRATMPLHPLLIEGLASYGDEILKQGRFDEAERLFDEALDRARRRARLNPSDDRYRQTLDRIVRVERDHGRTKKADEYAGRLLGDEPAAKPSRPLEQKPRKP